jgi:thiol:disulfide interchange protein DsbD
VIGSWLEGPGVEKDLVQARVAADVKAVGVGETFRVGVVLKMKPGWHIYWRNPGDSGAATFVKFTVPEDFEVSELRWPVPVKFEQPGGLVGYGYEGEVMLWAVVRAPESARVGESITVKAEVEWLVCEKVCVPGEAKLSVTVPVRKTEPADRERFDRWEAQLPGEGGEISIKSSGTLEEGRRGEFAIAIEAKEPLSKVEFFPVPEEALSVEDVRSSVEGKRGRISFDARVLAGQRLSSEVLCGVVAVTGMDGKRRGVSVEVPLSATR